MTNQFDLIIVHNSYILHQFKNGHLSSDSVVRDYCDGKAFKNHPLTIQFGSWIQVSVNFTGEVSILF